MYAGGQDIGTGNRRQSLSLPVATPRHQASFQGQGSPPWTGMDRTESGGPLLMLTASCMLPHSACTGDNCDLVAWLSSWRGLR